MARRRQTEGPRIKMTDWSASANRPLSPCLFRHGERVRVRGSQRRRRKLLPLTPTLSPQAGRGGLAPP
jgi:hypothetical protein